MWISITHLHTKLGYQFRNYEKKLKLLRIIVNSFSPPMATSFPPSDWDQQHFLSVGSCLQVNHLINLRIPHSPKTMDFACRPARFLVGFQDLSTNYVNDIVYFNLKFRKMLNRLSVNLVSTDVHQWKLKFADFNGSVRHVHANDFFLPAHTPSLDERKRANFSSNQSEKQDTSWRDE